MSTNSKKADFHSTREEYYLAGILLKWRMVEYEVDLSTHLDEQYLQLTQVIELESERFFN